MHNKDFGTLRRTSTQLHALNASKNLKSPPTTEPVQLDDNFREHIAFTLDDTSHNNYLKDLITAARRHVEHKRINRSLITQTWELYLDTFPDASPKLKEHDRIKLPMPPVQSVTTIEYTDKDGTTNTFSSSKYNVNTNAEPGLIVLKDGEDWPNFDEKTTEAVRVEYDAGYGNNQSDVPRDIRVAIMQIAAHWFRHRESVSNEGGEEKIPMTVDFILDTYKVPQLV